MIQIEIFDPENSILVTNGIRLGINSRDLTYKSDTDKKYFAFAQQGSLWLYETGTKKLTQVFSSFRMESWMREIFMMKIISAS